MMAIWLTVKEAAKHVKRGTGVIYGWVNTGRLPAYHPTGSGRLIIKQEDLDRFIEGFQFQVAHDQQQPEPFRKIIDHEYAPKRRVKKEAL